MNGERGAEGALTARREKSKKQLRSCQKAAVAVATLNGAHHKKSWANNVRGEERGWIPRGTNLHRNDLGVAARERSAVRIVRQTCPTDLSDARSTLRLCVIRHTVSDIMMTRWLRLFSLLCIEMGAVLPSCRAQRRRPALELGVSPGAAACPIPFISATAPLNLPQNYIPLLCLAKGIWYVTLSPAWKTLCPQSDFLSTLKAQMPGLRLLRF